MTKGKGAVLAGILLMVPLLTIGFLRIGNVKVENEAKLQAGSSQSVKGSRISLLFTFRPGFEAHYTFAVTGQGIGVSQGTKPSLSYELVGGFCLRHDSNGQLFAGGFYLIGDFGELGSQKLTSDKDYLFSLDNFGNIRFDQKGTQPNEGQEALQSILKRAEILLPTDMNMHWSVRQDTDKGVAVANYQIISDRQLRRDFVRFLHPTPGIFGLDNLSSVEILEAHTTAELDQPEGWLKTLKETQRLNFRDLPGELIGTITENFMLERQRGSCPDPYSDGKPQDSDEDRPYIAQEEEITESSFERPRSFAESLNLLQDRNIQSQAAGRLRELVRGLAQSLRQEPERIPDLAALALVEPDSFRSSLYLAALANSGHPAAQHELTEHLSSTESTEEQKLHLIRTLMQIEQPEPSTTAFLFDLANSRELDQISSATFESYGALVGKLVETDNPQAQEMMERLIKLTEQALQSQDERTQALLSALGNMGSKTIMPVIASALTDGDEATRPIAIRALRKLSEESILEVLAEAQLKQQSLTTRAAFLDLINSLPFHSGFSKLASELLARETDQKLIEGYKAYLNRQPGQTAVP